MNGEAGTPLGPNRRRGVVAVTVVNIAAGLAAGWVVLVLSRPSQDELQRAALDEIGLPVELERAPVLGPALDTYTERVSARVVAESRPSAAAALGAGVLAAAGCSVATAEVAGRERLRRGSIARRSVLHDCAEEGAEEP